MDQPSVNGVGRRGREDDPRIGFGPFKGGDGEPHQDKRTSRAFMSRHGCRPRGSASPRRPSFFRDAEEDKRRRPRPDPYRKRAAQRLGGHIIRGVVRRAERDKPGRPLFQLGAKWRVLAFQSFLGGTCQGKCRRVQRRPPGERSVPHKTQEVSRRRAFRKAWRHSRYRRRLRRAAGRQKTSRQDPEEWAPYRVLFSRGPGANKASQLFGVKTRGPGDAAAPCPASVAPARSQKLQRSAPRRRSTIVNRKHRVL